MKKIITGILTTVILCSATALASEIPSHPNFTVIEQVKYYPWGDGFIRFQENGKTGYKDLDGNVIIKPEWDEVQWNHNDEYHQTFVAGVKKDGLWGIIDKQGNIICAPKWKDILINRDQIRVLDANDKYGFLDGYGNMMIEPKYDYVQFGFWNDVAQVGRDFGYTIIDEEGNELMPLQPVEMNADHLGEYFYYHKDSKGFILDRSGNIVSNGKYDEIRMYHKDCIIAKQNGKWGVISINDETIIPFQYDRLDYFYGVNDVRTGIFYATKGEKSGYFNENGTLIGNFEWDAQYIFLGFEVILTRKDYKYGLMGKDGVIISEPVFEDVYSFSDNFFNVQQKGLVGVLKRDGTYLIEPKFNIPINGIRELENGYFELLFSNIDFEHGIFEIKYGLLDKNGNLIIEPMFDRLGWKDGQLIVGLEQDWYSIKLADNPEIRSDDILTRRNPTPEADFLVEQGILKGDENGDLRLWDTVTRAEFVTLIQRIDKWESEEENTTFEDVQNHWAMEAIATATKKGIIKGYDEKTFKPDECVTYTQAMTIILRAMGFTDEYIEIYPAGGVSTLAQDAKITPQGLSYSWGDAATREAVAIMLYRYIHTDMTVEKVKELPPKHIEYF